MRHFSRSDARITGGHDRGRIGRVGQIASPIWRPSEKVSNLLTINGWVGRRVDGHGIQPGYEVLRVRAAFFAAADLSAAERWRAAERVCRDNASDEAAAPLSRCRAFNVARERLAVGFLPESASSKSRCALRRVASEVLPGFGGANFTPARRALESPMAMACFVERAPCFPARISSISSRTNSPACVEADFPSRSSRRARSMVCFFGIID